MSCGAILLGFKIDDVKYRQDDPYQEHHEHGVPPLDPPVRTSAGLPLPRLTERPLQRLRAVLGVQLDLRPHGLLDALVDPLEVVAQVAALRAAGISLGLRKVHERHAAGAVRGWGWPQLLAALGQQPVGLHRDLDGLQRVQVLLPDEVVDAFDIRHLQHPKRTPGLVQTTQPTCCRH